jgi:iron complex transport system substrate-binding protein
MKSALLLSALLFLLTACSQPDRGNENHEEWKSIALKYATGFTLEQSDHAYRVKLSQPYKGAKQGLTYIFHRGIESKNNTSVDAQAKIPIKTIVCTSTTHIPLLDYLEKSDALVGFPTLDYISSDTMRKRINSGKVSELGIDEALNLEKLIDLRPDLVMGYSLSGDLGQFTLVEETGIPVILNAEYLETHPLGRAEWIKLAGILFDELDLADSVFDLIEEEYLKAGSLMSQVDQKPSALSGVVYGDSWYLPGGKNYASTLLNNAGYDFFWKSDTTSAFLPLSFETVFDQAHNSDYWIGVASYRTLVEIAEGDQRYTSFQAYKTGNVYSYNKRIGEKGGSEFLELGYLRPDLILKDLIKIAHPELLPRHELYFHFKLP